MSQPPLSFAGGSSRVDPCPKAVNTTADTFGPRDRSDLRGGKPLRAETGLSHLLIGWIARWWSKWGSSGRQDRPESQDLGADVCPDQGTSLEPEVGLEPTTCGLRNPLGANAPDAPRHLCAAY